MGTKKAKNAATKAAVKKAAPRKKAVAAVPVQAAAASFAQDAGPGPHVGVKFAVEKGSRVTYRVPSGGKGVHRATIRAISGTVAELDLDNGTRVKGVPMGEGPGTWSA